MTRFELPDTELTPTVREVINLYDQAQNSVFKLMASVSPSRITRKCRISTNDPPGFCTQVLAGSQLPSSPHGVQRKDWWW